MQTQYQSAVAGVVTPAMVEVARKERWTPEAIRAAVAAGHVVIPANPAHTNLEPMGIGSELLTKVNANLGNSALSSGPGEEKDKLEVALTHGADTVMDLSTGPDVAGIRMAMIARSPVPVGTVPIYEAVERIPDALDLTAEHLLTVIKEQACQGVDYMTLHAGLLRAHLPAAKKRLLGIVSRGGALLALWMEKHQRENPLYERFDDVLAICREHDVTISLGDGLRPGCLADASDAAQFGELDAIASLVFRCRAAGVQVMVEGPGHVPLNEVAMNMEREAKLCDNAPFYVLGPVVTDCAPGYDHVTAAIGGTLAAYHGAAMLCYVTPKEHLGLPNARDVREGLNVFKLAAHAADVARNRPGARERDDAISRARAAFDWEAQFKLAIDPAKARELRQEALRESGVKACAVEGDKFCTMCGPKFCSMRLSRQLRGEDVK
jgi:phosphomethylpyrimidine synthase